MSYNNLLFKKLMFAPLVFLFLFSLPFYYNSTGDGLFDLSSVSGFPLNPLVFFFLALMVVIVSNLTSHVFTVRFRSGSGLAFAFFSIIYIYFLISSLYGFQLHQFNFCLYMLSIYFFSMLVAKDAELANIFISGLVYVGLLHGAVGLYMMFFGGVSLVFDYAAQYPNYFRLHGLMANPNYAANVVGLAFLFCFYRHGSFNKWVPVLLMILFILTFSRGAILALFLSLVISALLVGSWRKLFKFSIFVMVGGLLFLMIIDGETLSKVFRVENAASLSGRLGIWEDAYREITRGPLVFLFGHGYGSFSRMVGAGAHSFFVKALFENGFVFVLLFCIFSLFIIYKAKREVIDTTVIIKNKSFLFIALFLFFLIRSFTSPSIFNGGYPGFVFVFLLAMYFVNGPAVERKSPVGVDT